MGDTIKFQWSGVEGLVAKIKRHADNMPKILASVIFMEGEELIGDAKKLTPVDHGFLVNSGHVNLPEFNGPSVSVEAGFGGVAGVGNQGGTNQEDVGYAVYVHEDLTKHHTVGQAKFLEQPFDVRKQTMSDRMAGRIGDQLDALG